MQDFLYLFIGGDDEDRSPEEAEKNMEQWMGWIGRLREAGVYKAGDPLEKTGKTIAGVDKIVTDGPFAESKEVVGGYIYVTTENLDKAVELAKGCPIFADGGRVEVRPVMQLDI